MKKNEHVYLKKICDHKGREVWLVDGGLVRRDIDEDFTQYDQHAHLRFIPKNEIWIEKETVEDEWDYFLKNIDRETEYMEAGLSWEDAIDKANEIEQSERYHSPRMQKILSARNAKQATLDKIRKQKLPEYSTDKFTVWLVDGEAVRDAYKNDFGDGGHGYVYSWVPKDEVWLEEVLSPDERKFILLHELHERRLMHDEGKDYEHAHMGATIIEDRYRENPRDLEERIREEMGKNNF